MSDEIVELHHRAPFAPAFMARAMRRSPGLPRDERWPCIVERWKGLAFAPGPLGAFRQATGLADEDGVPVLYPHVVGFRLQMALLTHRAYPLPIWSALQIRNRLVRHRRIHPGEPLELETRAGAHRIVHNGVEVELRSRLTDKSGGCCWESEITYLHRGRFGAPGTRERQDASPLLPSPLSTERFEMPRRGGWGFGKLTGDYNGIHYWGWYARRLGFRAAFPHPQRVAGLCMARLPPPRSEAQTLELWIKGPLYYGASVVLGSAPVEGGIGFGLSLEGDSRIAFVGQWREGAD